MSVADLIAHLDHDPVVVDTREVQPVSWTDVSLAFRDHADTMRNALLHPFWGWHTIGEYAQGGGYVTVVACKIGDRVEYGHIIGTGE